METVHALFFFYKNNSIRTKFKFGIINAKFTFPNKIRSIFPSNSTVSSVETFQMLRSIEFPLRLFFYQGLTDLAGGRGLGAVAPLVIRQSDYNALIRVISAPPRNKRNYISTAPQLK